MEIVERDGLRVVGRKVEADWEQLWTVMPEAWKEFIARCGEIGHRTGDAFLDLSLGREGDLYTQLVCVEVSELAAVPEEMVTLEIPSQSYIRHRHIGPAAKIAESFGAMYEWARSNGHPVDAFKIDHGYTEGGQEEEHELFIRLLDPVVGRPVEHFRTLLQTRAVGM